MTIYSLRLKNTNATKGDPNHFRLYYNKLLETKPEYLRAVCNLVLVDFVCLPFYKLPKGCEYLEDARQHAVKLIHSTNQQSP